MPSEVVERLSDEIEAVGREARRGPIAITRVAAATGSSGRRRRARQGAGVEAAELAEDVRRRVPQLVAEAVIALGARQVEAHVAAGRHERGEREAQRVGADGLDALRKFLARRALDRRLATCGCISPSVRFLSKRIEIDAVDEIERIEDVALASSTSSGLRVADQGVDVDVAERHVAR